MMAIEQCLSLWAISTALHKGQPWTSEPARYLPTFILILKVKVIAKHSQPES